MRFAPYGPEDFNNFLGVTIFCHLMKPVEVLFEIRNLDSGRVQDFYFFMKRGHHLFIGIDEFLLKLFSRPDSGKFNFDILVRDISGKLDHSFGEVDNFDGLAHLQQKDIAAAAKGGGLQNQLGGFGNEHEKPFHIGMGDRDRSAFADLLFEQGDHTAVAPQDVAKTNDHKLGFAVAPNVLNIFFRDALGHSHDAGGPHHLVGRNQNKFFNGVFVGGLGHQPGAVNIIDDRFIRVLLHQGNMLVRRRMENQMGPVPGKERVQFFLVGDRTKQIVGEYLAGGRGQSGFQLVQIVLAPVHHDERGRIVLQHLLAKLGPDRPPGTRDENTFALHHLFNGRQIEGDLFPAQQVLDLDTLDLRDVNFLGGQVEYRSHHPVFHSAPGADIDDLSQAFR